MYLSSHVFKLFFKMYECSLSNCFTSFNILDIVLCPSMTSFVGSQFLLKTMKILFSCWKMTPLIIIILTYPKRVVQTILLTPKNMPIILNPQELYFLINYCVNKKKSICNFLALLFNNIHTIFSLLNVTTLLQIQSRFNIQF